MEDAEVFPVQYPEARGERDNFLDNLDVLGLDSGQEEMIRKIHLGLLDPVGFKSCKRWIDQCYHRPSYDELRMCAYDEILEGYGIKAHFGG